MEFSEKLSQLRKNKGLTQEELAEALYVSRTAVSKWESGRGYPNIDSLKDISKFFSVSIDDLLSGEKLLTLAQKENKENIKRICSLLYGVVDLFSFVLIFFPIYPNKIYGFVYSVNLLNYVQISEFNKAIYWIIYLVIFALGFSEVVLTKKKSVKKSNLIMELSLIVNISAVIFMALTREVYALVFVFLLLISKAALLFKSYNK